MEFRRILYRQLPYFISQLAKLRFRITTLSPNYVQSRPQHQDGQYHQEFTQAKSQATLFWIVHVMPPYDASRLNPATPAINTAEKVIRTNKSARLNFSRGFGLRAKARTVKTS